MPWTVMSILHSESVASPEAIEVVASDCPARRQGCPGESGWGADAHGWFLWLSGTAENAWTLSRPVCWTHICAELRGHKRREVNGERMRLQPTWVVGFMCLT